MVLEIKINAPVAGVNRSLLVAKSPVRIGRNQLNDISLDDPFVSEWHGIIRFDDKSVAYFDLGSTNGTLLDGTRLAKNVGTELSDASRLQLGLLEVTVLRDTQKGAGQPGGPSKTIGWGRPLPAATTPHPGATPPPVLGAPSVGAASGIANVTLDDRAQTGTGLSAATGASPKTAPDAAMAALIERQRTLLEAFSEAFVGLRKGYEQFGSEVGVRTINGSTPLHRARNSREVLKYLMYERTDPEVAGGELIAIFADFGIHHIAMMEGITESVRAVLQSMDPRANDLEAGPRLWTTAKTKSQWRTYLERFDQVVTEDSELHAAIFGGEFARAYASVSVGTAAKPPPKDDGD